MNWLIWSFEHEGWWGPQERGYVSTVREAGRYTAAEACEIMARAEPGNEKPVREDRAADDRYPAGVGLPRDERVGHYRAANA